MKVMITGIEIFLIALWAVAGIVSAQRCGRAAGGARCPNFQCCSTWAWCGDNHEYCAKYTCRLDCWSSERLDHRCGSSVGNPPCGQNRCCGVTGLCGAGSEFCSSGKCKYRCTSTGGGSEFGAMALPGANLTKSPVGDMISESVFHEMFPLLDDCPGRGFYSYQAFHIAAESFPGFVAAGDITTRKREVAAFLAQVSEVTSGLCHINSTATKNDYCPSAEWPCAPGKVYNPRGPIQLSHNFNYGLAGKALGEDLINYPELVQRDPIVSFKTAIWFWMAKHNNRPSCHEIVLNANSGTEKVPMGLIGNIINRGLKHHEHSTVGTSSIWFYKKYCDLLGVSYGHDLNFWFDTKA